MQWISAEGTDMGIKISVYWGIVRASTVKVEAEADGFLVRNAYECVVLPLDNPNPTWLTWVLRLTEFCSVAGFTTSETENVGTGAWTAKGMILKGLVSKGIWSRAIP